MRMTFTNTPVDEFDIAPGAPSAVAKAHATFVALADQYRETKAELEDLPEQARAAIGEAHAAAAEARVYGGPPPKKKPDQVEAEFTLQRVKLASALETADQALDAAGDELCQQILANKDAWLASLDKTEAAAAKKLTKALDAARVALADLAGVRAAPAWLNEFTRNEVTQGRASGFGQQDLNLQAVQDVHGIVRIDGSTSPETLLDFLGLVADPPAPRVARPVTLAVESSRHA